MLPLKERYLFDSRVPDGTRPVSCEPTTDSVYRRNSLDDRFVIAFRNQGRRNFLLKKKKMKYFSSGKKSSRFPLRNCSVRLLIGGDLHLGGGRGPKAAGK